MNGRRWDGAVDVTPAGGATAANASSRRGWAWWVGVGAAALAIWAVLTWPLSLRLGDFQHWEGGLPGKATVADASVQVGDHLQNVFIYSVVIDNVRELREPFLDLREGAAGPTPLRTTSLNLPWTPVIAALWPLTGLPVAYNLTLAISTIATALTAYGLLRRHTRWPLLAAAGALLYAAAPHRMWQLVGHFNAVQWWAFPALLWAYEATMQRWHTSKTTSKTTSTRGHSDTATAASSGNSTGVDGSDTAGSGVDGGGVDGSGVAGSHPALSRPSRWRGPTGWATPAAILAATALTVGLSGEFHLALYVAALLPFLAAYALLAARRTRTHLPWPPATILVVSAAGVAAYCLAAFDYVFNGNVDGGNGSWNEVTKYAIGPTALVRTKFGVHGEGLVYVGWIVMLLALAGTLSTLAAWRRVQRALPYALLLPIAAFFTFGPHLTFGSFQPYRFLFEQISFLSYQRVPQRLMVVTALLLVIMAVVAADQLGGLRWRRLAGRLPAAAVLWRSPAAARRLGAALTVALTLVILVDYRFADAIIYPGEADNQVIERLAADGDAAGPILGLPMLGKATHYNAANTYIAALSNRRGLSAYNQTPAPWLTQRVATLQPLNKGQVTGEALVVLRETGTRQVVVTNVAGVYGEGEWRATVNSLVTSGYFRLVATDAPLALLELTSP
jgi:hypothetical protein